MTERAEQFRKFASECKERAKEARTDLERRDFLDMAQVSMRAAAEYEGAPSWVSKPSASKKPIDTEARPLHRT